MKLKDWQPRVLKCEVCYMKYDRIRFPECPYCRMKRNKEIGSFKAMSYEERCDYENEKEGVSDGTSIC